MKTLAALLTLFLLFCQSAAADTLQDAIVAYDVEDYATAYDLLRHNGLAIGKRDFLGG